MAHAPRRLAGAVLPALLIALASVACGDDGAGEAPTTRFVPGPVSVVAPEHGVTYDAGPPAIIAVLDPALSPERRASVVATVNGADVSARLVDDGRTLVAAGLGDVMREGANTVVVTFEGASHEIGFHTSCGGASTGAACAQGTPALRGPTTAVEMSQATLVGDHLGGPGDQRALYLDGQPARWSGGHFRDGAFVFVAPPASLGTVSVEVEVNGRRSAPLVIALTAAPPLEVSPDEVLDGFATGLRDLASALRAFPPLASGDADTDAKVAALREVLEDDLDAMITAADAEMAALPAEAKTLFAQFLRQGALDTQMSGWVADASKADGVPQGFDEACEGDVLRVYRLVTYFKVVQDALQGAALMAAIFAVIVPPAAAWAVLFSQLAANTAGIIGTLELFIATTLPDIEAVTLDLPGVVARSEEVHVTGTVTFVYDPARKRAEIINWAVNSAVGKAIGDVFSAIGASVPIDQQGLVTLSERAIERTHDLANHLAQRASEEAGAAPAGFTLPADPLLLDFRAARFARAEHGPRGVRGGRSLEAGRAV